MEDRREWGGAAPAGFGVDVYNGASLVVERCRASSNRQLANARVLKGIGGTWARPRSPFAATTWHQTSWRTTGSESRQARWQAKSRGVAKSEGGQMYRVKKPQSIRKAPTRMLQAGQLRVVTAIFGWGRWGLCECQRSCSHQRNTRTWSNPAEAAGSST